MYLKYGLFSELMVFLVLTWNIHPKHHLQKINKYFLLFWINKILVQITQRA